MVFIYIIIWNAIKEPIYNGNLEGQRNLELDKGWENMVLMLSNGPILHLSKKIPHDKAGRNLSNIEHSLSS